MATMKCARQDKKIMSFGTGLFVLIAMIAFGALMLWPGLNADSLSSETYLLFIVWTVVGMIFFHHVIAKDQARHFGKAMAVWVVLISMVFLLGIIWMKKIDQETTLQALSDFHAYEDGVAGAEILAMSEGEYLTVLNDRLNTTNTISFAAMIGLFVISIGGFLSNYFSMKKYENELKDDVRKKDQHIIQLQQSFVVGVLTMIDSRDNSTGGHIKRTSDVMQIFLDELKKDESLGIDDDSYTYMITAAPMHDIGKIAIDDSILRKPGKLTPEEFDTMKSHTTQGARILWELVENEDNAKFRQIAVNMALYHHERVDGTGYPEQLKGDKIPLEARILAIADVYDALASKRSYKEEMSADEIHSIMLKGKGTQFDSYLFDLFEKARPKIEAYYASL